MIPLLLTLTLFLKLPEATAVWKTGPLVSPSRAPDLQPTMVVATTIFWTTY